MKTATAEASAMIDGGPSWKRATFVLGGWKAFETEEKKERERFVARKRLGTGRRIVTCPTPRGRVDFPGQKILFAPRKGFCADGRQYVPYRPCFFPCR